MSRVLVWKCDADGKLFEDEKKYKAHLRKLAAERRHQRKIEAAKVAHAEFIQQMCQVASFKELEEFIKDNWSWFFYNGAKREAWKGNQHREIHEYVSVTFTEIRWNDSLSNSHRCPMSGVTNWGGRVPGAPRGYPGWRCRVNIKVRTPQKKYKGKLYHVDGFGSSYFEGTPIGTGTGGGGGERDGVTSYAYDCEIWADDFKVINEMREKAIVWKELGGVMPVEFA